MALKALGGKWLAKWVVQQDKKGIAEPSNTQEQVLQQLLAKGRKTVFGEQHNLTSIQSHADFRQQVPIRSYEELRPYIDQIIEGAPDVLWPGQPRYLAKTSGTTSGAKYIPVTDDSIPNHIRGARNTLLHYIEDTGNTSFLQGHMIFLSGNPTLEPKNGILTGRLSGIVNHHVPAYLQRNQVPSYATNCLEDWEAKVEGIIDETLRANMSLISGIPPWVQTYFDKLMARTGKSVSELFPEFSVMVHGGVNFSPYRERMMASIGKSVDTLETFPASEGFFAFQDTQQEQGMRLIINDGIFYEFVPLSEVHQANPTRLTIDDVETNRHYALIVSNKAGLWAYNVGDTVKFISKYPHRIVVTGRIKHYISAFGEHVIAEEVEHAIQEAAQEAGAHIAEFTVAPNITPAEGYPRHEWYIEFAEDPDNFEAFRQALDAAICRQNIYYRDLIDSGILEKLHIRKIRSSGFHAYLKAQGKLGGQNKPPHLANDRHIADELEHFLASNSEAYYP
jgi:hypothetical protein